ncbi:hypothetical protein DRP05_10355 [Archaeoglobales archaeon]|nr:MAG: hypothetical protein DRP05_10355 [Archaeoglobales archaeon]
MADDVRVPEGWKRIKLGEIAEVVSGFGFPVKYQGRDSGDYPFIKVEDLNRTSKYIISADNYIDKATIDLLKAKIFPSGTIIFPKIGMAVYHNKYRILKVFATFDNNIAGVILTDSSPEFLYYYFLWAVDLKQIAGETAVPSVKKSSLELIPILLPPLPEQRKIAEILETIDNAIEKTDKIIEKYKRIKQGLMQDLLTKGITAFEFEKNKLVTAVRIAFECGDHLFGREENLVSHLSRYLQEMYPQWDVDSEVEKNEERQRPDIIIHKRSTDKSLFAIEVKKSENLSAIKRDVEKLENLMLEEYHYEDAVFIGFNIENFEEIFDLSDRINFILVSKDGDINVKPRIRRFKDSPLGRMPEEWKVVELGEVSILKGRIGWHGLTTQEYLEDGEYYLVTGINFKDGQIDWNSCVYVSKKRYEMDKNIQLKENDVLVTKDGTIGKVAYVGKLPKPATLGTGVFVLRPIDDAYYPRYLYYVLTSFIFDKFIEILQAGSTINHLYQRDFVTFKIPLPPLPEQKRIASILSQIDKTIEREQKYKEKLERIKRGLMEDLLSGKVRVNHLIEDVKDVEKVEA